jgi:quinoprotein glucose dehydrogenase
MSFNELRKRSRGAWMAAGLVGLLALAAAGTVAQSPPPDEWWWGYGNTSDNARYFKGTQINKSNVSQLKVAWTYPFGETLSNPIVAHGIAYGRGRNGSIVALNAKTGQEIWVRTGMQGITTRGLNYWESANGQDRRLLFAAQDYLQALDARTGKPIMSFGTEGVVDLRQGVADRAPETIGRMQSGTPGEVFEDLIVLGAAPGEGYFSAPGDIRAYNVITGQPAWTFHTIPREGEFGYDTWPPNARKYIGATNVWGELSIDKERGIGYFPTGSPTYDFYAADRKGANLFGNCLIALDLRTGKRLWHFQNVHHDIQDLDNNAAPQLTTIRHNGRNVDVVAMAGKTGFLYVFDRVTGAPIWPIEERPVPKANAPGEEVWPTQPFTTNPPPFAETRAMTEADINPHLEPAAIEAFKKRLAASVNEGIFTPLAVGRETVQIPGSNGGALFGGTAAEPGTGIVYVITQNNPGMLYLEDPNAPQTGRGGRGNQPPPGLAVYQRDCQVCHGANREGTENGLSLLNIEQRLTPDQVRATIIGGKGRMAAFAHLNTEDLGNLVQYLMNPNVGRGGGGAGGRGGRGAGPTPDVPANILAGNGPVKVREGAGGRGGGGGRGARGYPEGVGPYTQYTINTYGTIGNLWKPPHTTIVKYDLNGDPSIKWRIGFGDDPLLASKGIFGTGTQQMRNSIIVTASGLIFGPGKGDHKVRAYDAEDGKILWTAEYFGDVVGSPAMYTMDGKQYLLVPASSGTGGGGGGGRGAAPTQPRAPNLPVGWVAYALP